MQPQTMPINLLPDNTADGTKGHDALQDLHNRITDALEGFRVMAAEAEPSFRPVVERFVAMHEGHAATVANMLMAGAAGGDLDGTLMGTVNRAVVSVRALFTDIDAGTLENIRSGEEYVLEAFDRAIGAVGAPADETALSAMQDELVTLLDDTHDPV